MVVALGWGGRVLGGPCAPHLQTPHSMEPLPPHRPWSCCWSRQWHLHWGRTCTVTVSVKPSARMSKDCPRMHSVAVTFTWKVTCGSKGRAQVGALGDPVSFALMLSLHSHRGHREGGCWPLRAVVGSKSGDR